MFTTRGWAAVRIAAVALGLCAATNRGLLADSIDTTATTDTSAVTDPSASSGQPQQLMLYTTMAETTATTVSPLQSSMTYSTSGSVGTTGITGQNVISFVPETGGNFTTPSAFSLGTFVVGYLPPGTTTSYDNTPFSITYTTQQVNGSDVAVNESPVTITGVLNGSVTGPSQSSVVATFDPIANPQFLTGDYVNNISVLDPKVSLVPSTTNVGRTTAQGHIQVTAAPIPEPATIALFAVAFAGLGLRHRLRRRAA